MPIVEPPAARHIVQDEGTTLEIIIPTPRNWITLVLKGIWVIPIGTIMVLLGGAIVLNLLLVAVQELESPTRGMIGIFCLVRSAWLLGVSGLSSGPQEYMLFSGIWPVRKSFK